MYVDSTSTMTAKDCIFDNVDHLYTWAGFGGGMTLIKDYNCYHNCTTTPTLATHEINADPLFAAAGSATLQLGSPCIDAGVVIPGYVDTYTGTAPDMGVYEMPGVPALSTVAASSITATSAALNGNITNDNGGACDQWGFDVGTSPGVYSISVTASGTFTTGAYSLPVTGLISNTTYYFRAKAHNAGGWGYGTELSFTALPTATTTGSEGIGEAQVTLQGSITSAGTHDQYGFDYGLAPGVYTLSSVVSGSFSSGDFSYFVTGLDINTTYYFRAKVHGAGGWGYGSEMSFTTLPLSYHVWDINYFYFDGEGGEINFDAGLQFDDSAVQKLTTNFTVNALIIGRLAATADTLKTNITLDAVIEYSKFIDLIQLVPEKFRSSQLLNDYLTSVGVFMGGYLSDIDGLITLLDPYSCPSEYLDKLAAVLGITLVRQASTTDWNLRMQIVQACDWIKLKGTYKAISIISYLSGLTTTIYDMYTEDYATFIREPFFIGNLGQNPGGLDSTYWKTPHFALEILLNTKYTDTAVPYLWHEDPSFLNISQQVEAIRPVTRVPHYEILLQADTDESGATREVPTNIETKVMNWTFSRITFDSGVHFDNGTHFDQSESGFLNSIVKWKLGIGNKGISPADSRFTGLQAVVRTGNIETITILSDRVEYYFEVPVNTVQPGISELGLFLSDGSTMVVASTFPDIDAHAGIMLKVRVRIFVQNL